MIKMYYKCMNFIERKNVLYRIISVILFAIFLGFIAFCLYRIITSANASIVLPLITVGFAGLMGLAQSIFIGIGGKKESHLYPIVFNENDRINNVFLIFVIAGTALGLGLFIFSLVGYFTQTNEKNIVSLITIMAVSLYVIINCIIYYIYLIMFKKREFNIKDLLK